MLVSGEKRFEGHKFQQKNGGSKFQGNIHNYILCSLIYIYIEFRWVVQSCKNICDRQI